MKRLLVSILLAAVLASCGQTDNALSPRPAQSAMAGARPGDVLAAAVRTSSSQTGATTYQPGTTTAPQTLFYTLNSETGAISQEMDPQPSGVLTNETLAYAPSFTGSWGWLSGLNEPDQTSWPAQTYTVALNVTNPNANLVITQVRIYRVDASGGPSVSGLAVVGGLSGLMQSLGSSGLLTFSISGAAQAASATDRLAVKFNVHNNATTKQSFSYDAGVGSLSILSADGGAVTASPSPSPAASPSPTATPSPIVSPSPSPLPTSTPSPTPSTTPSSSPSPACTPPATEKRWPVKVGVDSDAGSVNLTPQDTTIQKLRALAVPPYPMPENNRIAPTETTVFRLTGVTLIWIELSKDHDYHMVVKDSSGRTMIVESPNPTCVPANKSMYLAQMQSVRQYLDAHYTVTTTGQNPNVPVTLSGIGFFDYDYYGSYGEAPNGIELHALHSICIGAGCH
ncbi:MAG: hypothetical protein M3T49_00550 [Candidatus Eremiobacteraeota bacterium]|nr:hypothetical protein [Candidatus Eremiobacteraeota bacterium]